MLTASLASYSQTDITNNTDTSNVIISSRVARLILKDLIMFDGCKEELKLTQLKVTKLEERESQKDTIISLLESKDNNNQFIISQQGLQVDEFRNMTNDLKKEIKQMRVKTFLYKVGTFVGILTTSYLLIVR